MGEFNYSTKFFKKGIDNLLIEDEFYRIETVRSFREFFKKAATYILWFNWARRNRYKGGSPVEVWANRSNKVDDSPSPARPNRYIFPILLDSITPYILKQGGYHVPLPDKIPKFIS